MSAPTSGDLSYPYFNEISNIMKKKEYYEYPEIEWINVSVEKGFTDSAYEEEEDKDRWEESGSGWA